MVRDGISDPGYFMVQITHWYIIWYMKGFVPMGYMMVCDGISDPGYFMVPITHWYIIWYMKGLCTNGIYDVMRWDI